MQELFILRKIVLLLNLALNGLNIIIAWVLKDSLTLHTHTNLIFEWYYNFVLLVSLIVSEHSSTYQSNIGQNSCTFQDVEYL